MTAAEERAAIVAMLRGLSAQWVTPPELAGIGDPFGADGQWLCGHLADRIEAAHHLKEGKR